MSSDSKFVIRNSTDIIRKLTLLWKQRCLITASFGEPKESFITAITNVDKNKQTLTLDYGPKEHLNRQFMAASDVSFNTEISGIQVQFSQNRISKISSGGQTAFLLPIPETLYWLEHRQFYRMRSPMSNPATCTIKIQETEDDQDQTKEFVFNLFDMSISGLCLMNEPKDTADLLHANKIFDNCHIKLPEIGDFFSTIEIRSHRPLNSDKPDKTQLIGVQFLDVPPAVEAKIQRYMQLVERENRKKS